MSKLAPPVAPPYALVKWSAEPYAELEPLISENTNTSSSPTNPKICPGLAKVITEDTLKFPEGQPGSTFFHFAVADREY